MELEIIIEYVLFTLALTLGLGYTLSALSGLLPAGRSRRILES